jgi:hypothetical protein
MPTKSTPVTVGWTLLRRSYSGTNPSNWNVNSNISLRENIRSTSGERPDWKTRIRNGQSATSTLTGSRVWQEGSTSDHLKSRKKLSVLPDVPSNWTTSERVGSIAAILGLTAPGSITSSASSANNAAITDFIKHAIREQRSMQGGVFIGEIHEALGMIRNPMRLMYKGSFRHLFKVRQRVAKERRLAKGKLSIGHIRDIVANSYLETVFGWRPLISDVEDGIKALAKILYNPTPRKVVFGKGNSTKIFNHQNFGGLIDDFPYSGKGFTTETCFVRYKGAMKYAKREFSTAFGLSWSDIMPTVWELIPYSFIADYFTNLGDIIDAFSHQTIEWGWIERGQKRSAVKSIDVTVSPPVLPGLDVNVMAIRCGRSYHMGLDEVERTDYTGGSTIPSLEFRIPGLGLKWLNLAALLSTHRSASKSVYRL